MPTVADHATSAAPPEDVWKLLYDPSRFPEWWPGMQRVELGADEGDFTFWYEEWPDVAMPQKLVTQRGGARVTISCLVSFMDIRWELSEEGDGTRIDVTAAIPEAEAARSERVRGWLAQSVRQLAAVAATDAPPARG
ncbi:MAG TPA: SRPBCC family protein [Solirubrobacteraceae bacterium]